MEVTQVTFTARLRSHYKIYCSIPSVSDELRSDLSTSTIYIHVSKRCVSVISVKRLDAKLDAFAHFQNECPVHGKRTSWKNTYL